MSADLHTHSRVSDGTEAPAELIRAAVAAGLSTIALTDHDSTDGWDEASEAARSLGLRLLPGIELSTRTNGHSVHLLGYLVDRLDPELVAETERIRTSRQHRAEAIVERIDADYPLSWQDVLAQSQPGTTIGRPHIADALVARGYSANRGEAFAGILHPRSGYLEPHYAPDTLEGVRLIRAAGGVPVLAHPGTRGADRVVPRDRLAALVEAGLFGLEIDHPENREDAKAALRTLAREFGLATTGSSDYHGTGKVNRLGEHTTSPEVVEEIIRQARGSEPVH